jgi:hypothetical protein
MSDYSPSFSEDSAIVQELKELIKLSDSLSRDRSILENDAARELSNAKSTRSTNGHGEHQDQPESDETPAQGYLAKKSRIHLRSDFKASSTLSSTWGTLPPHKKLWSSRRGSEASVAMSHASSAKSFASDTACGISSYDLIPAITASLREELEDPNVGIRQLTTSDSSGHRKVRTRTHGCIFS